MPRDSQGNFTNVYDWEQDAANGIGIEADRHQEGDDDQAQGLTDSLDRKGRGGMQAALAMGNFAITQQGEGSGLTGGVNLGQVQKQAFSQGIDTGSANAYQVTLSPAPTAYTTGLVVRFVPSNANTGASTLQIGALTPAPALQFQNKDLVADAITTDSSVEAVFDGTSFQLISPTTTGTAASKDTGTAPDEVPTNADLAYIQTVRAETTAEQTITANIPYDNTKPQQTEGTEVVTVAITPKSAANNLRVTASIQCSSSASERNYVAALFRDSGADALQTVAIKIRGGDDMATLSIDHVVSAGSTSATTFKIRCGGADTNMLINRNNLGSLFDGTLISSISVAEISA